MQFISNGDFIFPFEAWLYWVKHLFIWSFQTGAPNLDGIIRIPGRLLEMLVFQYTGSLFASYFYLFFCFALIFISFYVFIKRFLHIDRRSIALFAALLFTFNPVFLGNISKIGLVMAAGLLPLCIVLVKETFERRQLRFLVGLIIVLNISFLHPYNFAVNILISLVYFAYLTSKNRSFFKRAFFKFAGIALLAVAMHAYMILPILQLGSVDKSVLSQDISEAPVDYSSLIDVANTGDLTTAFSLSKDVFKDYEFYDQQYEVVYFVTVFALYIMLLALYVIVEKRLKKHEKRTFLIFSAVYLLFLLLSTGTLFGIDAIIKYATALPGGWIFRSPLKWQLYMPFFFFAALFLLLRHVLSEKTGKISLVILSLLFLGSNGFLAVQVYQRLLQPRTVTTFKKLAETDLNQKRLLFINSDDCTEYAREYPTLFTELNQVLLSDNVQLKRVADKAAHSVYFANFDYIMSCQDSAEDALKAAPEYKKLTEFDDGGMTLYKNDAPSSPVYAFTNMYELQASKHVNEARHAVDGQQMQELHYVTPKKSGETFPFAVTAISNPFEEITADSIKGNAIVSRLNIPSANQLLLLQASPNAPLFWKIEDEKVLLRSSAKTGFTKLDAGLRQKINDQINGGELEFRYQDEAFTYANLVPNPSFENGLWQKRVNDCNNFDDKPQIGMEIETQKIASGNAALELKAARHTACTSPGEIPVQGGKTYLLSFEYLASSTKAGYNLRFIGDGNNFISERLSSDSKSGEWQHFSKLITVPANARALDLTVYGYPGAKTASNTYYDNFLLTEVPAISTAVYVVEDTKTDFKTPEKLEVEIANPARSGITVTGASTPFFLALNDSYHPKWRLSLLTATDQGVRRLLPFADGAKVREENHFSLNGGINGWFVEPKKVCTNGGCSMAGNGTYSFQLVAEFYPQRWLYLGLLVSAAAWISALGYMLYDHYKNRKTKEAVWSARE